MVAARGPRRLTQHSLRHAYISLRVAIGDDPAAISRDARHSDMGVTFRIYTHVMTLQQGNREHLESLVTGTEWAATGSESAALPAAAETPDASSAVEGRRMLGRSRMANPGLEPGTPRFSVVCSTS